MQEIIINILQFDTILFLIIYLIWFCLVILLPRKKIDKIYLENTEYKHYFLIPCLNEEVVITNTIDFWEGVIKNNSRINIIFINDDSEDNTELLISQKISGKKQFQLLNRRKPHAQTGKGNALNFAYQNVISEVKKQNFDSTQVLITIFDADAIIRPNYIHELETHFNDQSIALVQARVSIINKEKWLGLMQDIDFFTCVDGIQNFREHLANVGAGGNGQTIRLSSIIKQQEPWGEALLEDFEFSTRLLMQNYQTRHMHQEAVYQQGLDQYYPFIKQRARWAQGGIQCLKYIKEIFQNNYLSTGAKFEMLYFMILPFISIIGIISYLLLTFIYLATNTNYIDLNFIIIIFIMNFITGITIGAKYYYQTYNQFFVLDLIKFILIGCTIIIYDWCLVPCQIMAIYRQLRKRNNWVKTERKEIEYDNHFGEPDVL